MEEYNVHAENIKLQSKIFINYLISNNEENIITQCNILNNLFNYSTINFNNGIIELSFLKPDEIVVFMCLLEQHNINYKINYDLCSTNFIKNDNTNKKRKIN